MTRPHARSFAVPALAAALLVRSAAAMAVPLGAGAPTPISTDEARALAGMSLPRGPVDLVAPVGPPASTDEARAVAEAHLPGGPVTLSAPPAPPASSDDARALAAAREAALASP